VSGVENLTDESQAPALEAESVQLVAFQTFSERLQIVTTTVVDAKQEAVIVLRLVVTEEVISESAGPDLSVTPADVVQVLPPHFFSSFHNNSYSVSSAMVVRQLDVVVAS
jgi:hypothetical protein